MQDWLILFLAVLVVSGVFSMFGKGGGSLYTPILVMLGVSVASAISTALFLSLVTAAVATYVFARNKLVDFRLCFIFLPGTIVGSLIGAVLSSQAPKGLLLGIFSVFLYAAGFLMISSAKEEEPRPLRLVSARAAVVVVLFSFAVGLFSSLIGVGGGLIIFPFLVSYMKYDTQKAAGANSFIVAVSSLMGTIGHFALAPVDYLLIGITSVACIIGSAVGSNVTAKARPSFVKAAFALIMWFFATWIAVKLL